MNNVTEIQVLLLSPLIVSPNWPPPPKPERPEIFLGGLALTTKKKLASSFGTWHSSSLPYLSGQHVWLLPKRSWVWSSVVHTFLTCLSWPLEPYITVWSTGMAIRRYFTLFLVVDVINVKDGLLPVFCFPYQIWLNDRKIAKNTRKYPQNVTKTTTWKGFDG